MDSDQFRGEAVLFTQGDMKILQLIRKLIRLEFDEPIQLRDRDVLNQISKYGAKSSSDRINHLLDQILGGERKVGTDKAETLKVYRGTKIDCTAESSLNQETRKKPLRVYRGFIPTHGYFGV